MYLLEAPVAQTSYTALTCVLPWCETTTKTIMTIAMPEEMTIKRWNDPRHKDTASENINANIDVRHWKCEHKSQVRTSDDL